MRTAYRMPAPQVTVQVPPQAAPQVTVQVPQQPAPQVTVQVQPPPLSEEVRQLVAAATAAQQTSARLVAEVLPAVQEMADARREANRRSERRRQLILRTGRILALAGVLLGLLLAMALVGR